MNTVGIYLPLLPSLLLFFLHERSLPFGVVSLAATVRQLELGVCHIDIAYFCGFSNA
jgi:hypothetical protein